MDVYGAQLASVANAVRIIAPTRYAWMGAVSLPLPLHVSRRLDPAGARGVLTSALTTRVYESFYCSGGPVAATTFPRRRGARDAAFVEALRGADVARTGEEVRGFFTATSAVPFPPDAPVVRLYFNLRPSGGIAFVHAASRALAEAQVAARLRVVDHPVGFERCDAGVLFLAADDVSRWAPVTAALHDRLARHLDPRVPALTRALAPGLGLAEDPPGEESFGRRRSRVIAEGIVATTGGGVAREDAIRAALAADGVDPHHPYLRPGSTTTYDDLVR